MATHAYDVLTTLLAQPADHAFIDVRSEGEFAEGEISGFINLPILNNEERKAVGTTYKKRGQEAAIALGHELVDPKRPERVSLWRDLTHKSRTRHAFVSCWRGGLRSQIAGDWIKESGEAVDTVAGGYKAMRRVLLEALTHAPQFIRISGMTGSGKTELLHLIDSTFTIDLEQCARHRGSAFGKPLEGGQPAQATFENSIGLSILRGRRDLRMIEDESVIIGSVHLPAVIADKMRESPMIVIESSIEDRTRRIAKEYIFDRFESGVTADRLRDEFSRAFEAIRKRLGGQLTDQLKATMLAAFDSTDPAAHTVWIEILLREYYDRRYAWSAERSDSKVLLRGDLETCRRWIGDRFASLKP